MEKPHKRLHVWQQAMALVLDVYRVSDGFPHVEIYGIRTQIRRAVVSVVSNIAEGAARQTKKEFIQFLHVAQGSLSELDTQLEIATRLGYIAAEVQSSLDVQITAIDKMITGLIRQLTKR